MTPMSQRAYAKYRRARNLPGGTLKSVQKAIADGRIAVNTDGKIDPPAADRAWLQNTDPSRRPPRSRPSNAPAGSLAQQKILESIERTRALKLANDTAAGDLAPIAEYRRREIARVTTARNQLLGLPSRLKTRLPTLTREDLRVVDEEIRRVLNELAGGRAPDAEDTSC